MVQPLFFGRPPFAPLARAASALASDRTLPPLRPNATAAGFFRLEAIGLCARFGVAWTIGAMPRHD